MVATWCKLCQVSIDEAVWTEHVLMDKTHLTNLPDKLLVKGKIENHKIEQVQKYFRKFGKLKNKLVTKANEEVSLEFEFEDRNVHSIIIHRHHAEWAHLEICWKKSKQKKVTNIQLENLFKIVSTKSKQISSYLCQLEMFTSEVQMDRLDLADILERIDRDLQGFIDPSKILLVGSRFTGLDIHGSDLNVHIKDLSLRDIQDSIAKSGKFTAVNLFLQAVKCKHVETEMVCNFYVFNVSTVKNQQLIKYYASLDKKVSNLMLLLKFWSKKYKLVEVRGHSHPVMELLVIFFLQQPPYKLPPAAEILNKVAWTLQKGFHSPPHFPNLQGVTILDLLFHFFRFYATFDYFSYVVAPFCGLILEKTHFMQPAQLPDCYKKVVNLISNTHMCIQDVFEHNVNLLKDDVCFSDAKFAFLCQRALLRSLPDRPHMQRLFVLMDSLIYGFKRPGGFTEEEFFDLVTTATERVLTKILLVKKIERTHESDVNIRLVCQGDQDVWKNRVTVAKSLVQKDMTETEKEIAISATLSEARVEQRFNVILSFVSDGVECAVTGKTECYDKYHVGHFLSVKVGKYLEELVAKKKATRSDDDVVQESNQKKNLNAGRRIQTYASVIKNVPTLTQQLAVLQNYLSVQAPSSSQAIIDDVHQAFANTIPYKSRIYQHSVLQLPYDPLNICYESWNRFKNAKTTIRKLKNIKNKQRKFFDVMPMYKRHMLAMTHKATGRLCHLILKNETMLKKSWELIEYYLSLDEKIKKLVLVVELWSEFNGFRKSFSPYGLIHLVLFYLQREYGIPTVVELQKNVDLKMVDGWNIAFETPRVSTPLLQNVTLLELVENFFKFYSRFDYFSYVIAPYSGVVMEKPDFLPPYPLPDYYAYYKMNRTDIFLNMGMCIQDFFEHSKNLARGVHIEACARFAFLCNCTVHFIIKEKERFLPEFLEHGCNPDFRYYQFHLENHKKMARQDWRDLIRSLTGKTLTQVLNCKYREANRGGGVMFNCICERDAFHNRMQASKKALKNCQNLSEFNKEAACTSEVIRIHPKPVKNVAKLWISFADDFSRFFIETKRNNGSSLLFAHFFSCKFPRFLKEEIDATISHQQRTSSTMIRDTLQEEKSCNIQEFDVPPDFFDGFSDIDLSEHSDEEDRKWRKRRGSSSASDEIRNKRKRSKTPPVKRKSFLEEIQEKLGEINTPSCSRWEGPSNVSDIYDQSFFIGTQATVPNTQSQYDSQLASELFTEKKMSLTDYLTIRAKNGTISGTNKQDKNKILSLCYNALSVLTRQKLAPLKVQPTSNCPKQKYSSPMYHTTVRFNYTSPLKPKSPQERVFSEILLRDLQTIGLLDEEKNVWRLIDAISESLSAGNVIDKKLAGKILQVSLLGYQVHKPQKMVNVATQAEGVSVGVQVDVELRQEQEVLNQESIAYLTSAYLLGRERRGMQGGFFSRGNLQ